MNIERHSLAKELPEFKDKIHDLKLSDGHFSKLFKDYHEVLNLFRFVGAIGGGVRGIPVAGIDLDHLEPQAVAAIVDEPGGRADAALDFVMLRRGAGAQTDVANDLVHGMFQDRVAQRDEPEIHLRGQHHEHGRKGDGEFDCCTAAFRLLEATVKTKCFAYHWVNLS